jgi:opacity protein-like surface antigen
MIRLSQIPKRPANMNSFTRHLLGLASVAMLGFQATSVMAGDLLPPPPPPPQVYAPPPMAYQPLPLRRAVYGWGGGYAGGFLGSQCTDFVATKGTTVKGTSITETQTESGCTAQGGLMAGYNIQQNEIVYGIELDYAMSGEMLKESAGWGNGGMDPLLTLRGRAGYAFGSTMPYVTAGAAFAQGDLLDDKNWHSGWVVGAGVEQKVSESIALRAEFLHADFGAKTYGSTCCNGDIALGNVNMARLGLTWHFGQMIAPRPVYPVHVGG